MKAEYDIMSDLLNLIDKAEKEEWSALHISHNNLVSIPKEISKLTKLKILYLGNNQLESIPNELFSLINLEILDLGDNLITSLPSEICELTKLEILNLSNNLMHNIPKEVFQLPNLKFLYVNSNLIELIPKEIIFSSSLEWMSLANNPLKSPPLEVYSQGLEGIKDYFKSIVSSGSKELFEAKLLLVGHGGVGKTSLAKKLVNNSYALDENEETTEGINITHWNFKVEDNHSREFFRVNLWDFGGQEIYHSTHQFFLTKRSLYLFIWDARKEDDYTSFDYWLNTINLLSNNSPIFVILNKSDERIKEINRASYLREFNNIVSFHTISCKTGDGINELIDKIKKEIIKLPHIGSEWPESWAKIRDHLENLDKNYIEYNEYIDICKNYGLDKEQSNHLSSFLHDLGVTLHFQEDPILRNLVILNPIWGTNAVYMILDTRKIQEAKGLFSYDDLWDVWKDCQYTPDKYNELIRLMMKFELCFKLSDADKYIVPELLSDEEPMFSWDYSNNLRIEFWYDFMPAGIITRFISRNHTLVESNMYWRNGTILEYNNSTALILSYPSRRKIKIYVEGQSKKELLAIIKREFDHIHKTLSNPSFKIMVPCICEECRKQHPDSSEMYSLEDLERYVSKNKTTIECRKSFEAVLLKDITCGLIQEGNQTEGMNNVFISYSHKDSFWLERLKVHLKPYIRNNDIVSWDDTMIRAGEKWFESIQYALSSAKVVILLVSPDFLASDFIAQHELPSILKDAEKKGLTIVWIAVSSCSYSETEIAKYQCANNPSKPLDSLPTSELNTELVNICSKIKSALNFNKILNQKP